MIELICWAGIGVISGIIFGIIPGAGIFTATAVLYPILLTTSPQNIMMYYVAILITENYSNSVTSILYGIPGDATTITTAKIGHKFYQKGQGNIAVSTMAISSTIGVIFSSLIFLFLLNQISEIFNFYNSIIQTIVISISIILITFFNKQKKFLTLLLFLFGGVLSHVGIDPITHESFATFNNSYLSLGVPFSSVMIGMYIVPEICKNIKFSFYKNKIQNKFFINKKIINSAILGGFIGFWCGLIPGVTNILGSQLSASISKNIFNNSKLKILSAAESANNSGALSSLLPLLILAIPITGSEILIYHLMTNKGFLFNIENTLLHLTNIIYIIPIVIILTLYLSWYRFNLLGNLAFFYKEYKNKINILILLIISITSIVIYPTHEWMFFCIIFLSIIGYIIKKLDTVPVIYGFFLSDLFYSNLIRSIKILL